MQQFFSALEVDPREEKLPAWARDKLASLRRAATEPVADLKALKDGSEPGPFWLERYDRNDRFYLPKNHQISCGDPRRPSSWFDLRAPNLNHPAGWFSVASHQGTLMVAPWLSNVLLVQAVDNH